METFKNYYKILDNIGYLPGEIALPEGLTGWEFIKMMWSLRKVENKERLEYLLDKFQLVPSGEMKKMSLGDKENLPLLQHLCTILMFLFWMNRQADLTL